MSNSKRLLVSQTNWREYMEVDADDPRKMTMFTAEDCTDIVAEAKILSEMEPGKELRHVAKIPRFILDRAFREGWFNDKQKWRDWANDPDNRAFRTWPGKL